MPTTAGASDIATLDANLERVLSLEQQTSTARATVHEALCNLLQSRTELSTSGHMLSAATRAAMGKRGVAQLESVKGILDMSSDTAALVRADATNLRDEVRSVVQARDAALAAVERAEAYSAETCERVEAEGTAAVLASNEVATRAEQAAAQAIARAEAAELRAEQAERGFVEAERARSEASDALISAEATRSSAVSKLTTVEAQLSREREVLAKVMAENVLFVKKIEFAEAERAKALEEKEALRTAWREQTEDWFANAAGELQQRLLNDWGAADTLQTELAQTRRERAKSDAANNEKFDELSATESRLRSEGQQLAAEREALLGEREELTSKLDGARSQLKAAAEAGHQLIAQAEVRDQQIEEFKAADRERLAKGEETAQAALELRAALDEKSRECTRVKQALEACEEKLRLTTRVSERVRAEAADEHQSMLETNAKFEELQEHYDTLLRQNSALVRSTENLSSRAPVASF